MNMVPAAASTMRVVVPSPLEGEGCSVLSTHSNRVRGSLPEKSSCEEGPSPILALSKDPLALSLKGRGHINAHPIANR